MSRKQWRYMSRRTTKPTKWCAPSEDSDQIFLKFGDHRTELTYKSSWATTWQNQQSECVPSEGSDQPGHPPSLIRVFAVRMKKPWVLSYPLSAQRRLIRQGGCPGWSESSLGAYSFCWFCHVVAQQTIRYEERLCGLAPQNHAKAPIKFLLSKTLKCDIFAEIPTCLGEITGDNVVMIIEGLASKNKWRQMDTFVRKYRILHPTESLKNFASSMSVVPMLRDSALKNAEETKLQILKTMVGGGATLGSDGKYRLILNIWTDRSGQTV